jgi:hypothetical protein
MDAPRWEVSWCLPVMDLRLVLPSARADMVSLVGVTATTRVGVKPSQAVVSALLFAVGIGGWE